MESLAWLIPAGSASIEEGLSVQAPAGVLWDAVRTSRAHGEEVLQRLLGNERDADLLGPVLVDEVSARMYWLVSPGASGEWPDGARLLGSGSWVTVATSALTPARNAAWVHLPSQRIVSGAAWLAAALAQRTCDYCGRGTDGPVVREDPTDPTSRRVALDHGPCRLEFSAEMALWSDTGTAWPMRPAPGWCDVCGTETERGRRLRETTDREGAPATIARCLPCCQLQEQPPVRVPLQSYADVAAS